MAAQAGIRGPAPQLLAEVSAISPWPFTYFGVTIEKDNDTPLGLELDLFLNPDADHMWERLGPVVKRILDWGSLAMQPQTVKAKDVLIQVNSVHGSVPRMADELSSAPVVTLYFLRVDVPQSVQASGLGGKPPAAAAQAVNKKRAKKGGKAWKPVRPAAADLEVDGKTTIDKFAEVTISNEAALPKALGAEVAGPPESALPKDLGAKVAVAAQWAAPFCVSAGALLPAAA